VPKRVLIIEDDFHSRSICGAILRHGGYETVEVPTGEEGLEAAASDPPDLILLDIGLPGIDGWEVCVRLKQMAATAATKIIILTAHAFLADQKLAEACGAEMMLTKPIEPTLVRQHVIQVIGPPAS
jgi:two-component system, cell cycle response regulator DivK